MDHSFVLFSIKYLTRGKDNFASFYLVAIIRIERMLTMNKTLIEELKRQDCNVIAVSKTRTKEEIDEVAKLGLTTFGENRVQEFLDKYDEKYTWHIIGHLQTNKVKYIIGKVDVIESLDSLKLAQEIEKQASKQNLIQKVLVELKISEDPNKTGYPFKDAKNFIEELQQFKHIQIKGIMCVATKTEDTALVESEFEQMHQLYLELKEMYPNIDTLSMGMSQDYKLAIKHGSNTIRIGHAIFE